MKSFNPVDWVVLILALVVAITLGAFAINSVVNHLSLTNEKLYLVQGLYSGTISVIALYVGSRLKNDDNDKKNK
jgi:hypothetical protein